MWRSDALRATTSSSRSARSKSIGPGNRPRVPGIEPLAPMRTDRVDLARRSGTKRRGGPMGRVMADCRRWESENNCSLTIIGDEDEVVRAASAHAIADHGHEDTAELRDQVRGML